MLSYNKGINENKNWILCEEEFNIKYQGKCESIMALGNGYLGIRSSLEEAYMGQTRNLFVAGTFNRADKQEAAELPNAADVCEMEIHLNDELFDMTTGVILEYKRYLNLREAQLIREVLWESPKKQKYNLIFKRFVSLADYHTIAFQVAVTPLTADAVIKVKTGIDGKVTNSGSQHFYEGDKRVYDREYMQLIQTTTETEIAFSINCCIQSDIEYGELKAKEFGVDRRKVYGVYELSAQKDKNTKFEKIVSVFTSLDKEYKGDYSLDKIKADSLNYLKSNSLKGYNQLLDESRERWLNYWEQVNIQLDSTNEEDLLAIRFAQYHLLIMTPVHDSRFSIGAKGLTGEGYKGHVFWDTEMFILPYFQYHLPAIARQLLIYRYNNIEGARNKAHKFGYEGAMYPWESALTGEEETPEWAALNIMTGKPTRVWSGVKEHHITADIAYAVWQYYLSTNDAEFMHKYGYEIILECAWFWCSRMKWNHKLDRYEINDIIGPDEYTEHVNNNAYTNYMAHYAVTAALCILEELQKNHIALFNHLDKSLHLSNRYPIYKKAQQKLYLPKANIKGIIPQDDTFLEKDVISITSYRQNNLKQSILLDYSREQIIDLQVLKQADVVMLFSTLKKIFNTDIIEANWKYYESKTIHDSSLSKAVHSITAIYHNNTKEAYHCFRDAIKIDMGENPISSDKGIHAAAMGGIWMAAVFGFGGIYNNEGMLEINPALPEEWSQLKFNICWKGIKLQIEITKETVCIFSDSSKEINIKLNGFVYSFKNQLSKPSKGVKQ